MLDGLRPDYVTKDVMPHVFAIGRRGVVFTHHHSVFPTVTRVNASSIVTGSYPAAHGLMGNSVFFPQVRRDRFLDTEERANLLDIDAAVQGALLTAPALGESLQAAGKKLLVVSAGSTGSSFLLNHKVAGGAVLHSEYVLPDTLRGEFPPELAESLPPNAPSSAKNRRAVDLLLQVGLPKVAPAVTVLWLTDPDTTAHQHGIGDPVTVDALRRLDGEVKRVEDGLARAGLMDTFDIWVTSDHGFSTYTGGIDLDGVLSPFAATLPDGSPRIVAGGGAVYVRDHDQAVVAGIVKKLQRTDGVGAIFTPAMRPGSWEGRVPGTLSFDAIRWNHDRSADILFSPDWTDRPNAFGFRGTTASRGVAGHGSSSPFDIHNVLVAAGPDLKQRVTFKTPTGNVDFATTFLHLLGIPIPSSMEGRVLAEALRDGPDGRGMATRTLRPTTRSPDGSYALTAVFSLVQSGRNEYRYFDYTEVRRSRPSRP